MKKRVKKKLRNRYGYKRYDYYRAYLDAKQVIQNFLNIIKERDCNYIYIISSFDHNNYHHKFILFNEQNKKDMIWDYRINLFVFTVNNSDRPTKFTCTKKGFIFYKTIRDYFKDNESIYVTGNIEYMYILQKKSYGKKNK